MCAGHKSEKKYHKLLDVSLRDVIRSHGLISLHLRPSSPTCAGGIWSTVFKMTCGGVRGRSICNTYRGGASGIRSVHTCKRSTMWDVNQHLLLMRHPHTSD